MLLNNPYRFEQPFVDSGLPASVSASSTGRWSTWNAADYTLDGSSEVLTLNDLSGNGATLGQASTNGPTLVSVDGFNWMNFTNANQRLSATAAATSNIDPGAGDISMVVLVRKSVTSIGGLFLKGGSIPHFGFFSDRVSSGDMEWRMRDTVFGNTLSLTHNKASAPEYNDGTKRLFAFTYDDSIADALLYGGENDPSAAVASDLVYASANIIPTGDFELGSWSITDPWKGDIAEIMFFDKPLSPSELSDVYTYLTNKWLI